MTIRICKIEESGVAQNGTDNVNDGHGSGPVPGHHVTVLIRFLLRQSIQLDIGRFFFPRQSEFNAWVVKQKSRVAWVRRSNWVIQD